MKPVPITSDAEHAGASGGVPASTESLVAPEPVERPALIETMRMGAGRTLPLLDHHLDRLERSCHALSYSWPGRHEIIQRLQSATAALDTSREWRVRMLLAADGILHLEYAPLHPLPSPLHLVVAGPRISGAEPWLLYKTTHRPWYETASAWLARRPDIFDVIFWNAEGEICEGSRSNVYILSKEGQWLTPPLAAGALPGVQRQLLLESGKAHESVITREQFLNARTWRVSNALRGWCTAVLRPTPPEL